MKTKIALAALVCVAATAFASASAQTTAKPAFGTWGVDLTSMDRSVKPGDKYYLPPDQRVHLW